MQFGLQYGILVLLYLYSGYIQSVSAICSLYDSIEEGYYGNNKTVIE